MNSEEQAQIHNNDMSSQQFSIHAPIKFLKGSPLQLEHSPSYTSSDLLSCPSVENAFSFPLFGKKIPLTTANNHAPPARNYLLYPSPVSNVLPFIQETRYLRKEMATVLSETSIFQI